MKIAVPLAENVLTPLVTMASASATNGAIQRKIRGRGVVKARKGINLIPQYVIRKFRCFSVGKYVNWKCSHKRRKRI